MTNVCEFLLENVRAMLNAHSFIRNGVFAISELPIPNCREDRYAFEYVMPEDVQKQPLTSQVLHAASASHIHFSNSLRNEELFMQGIDLPIHKEPVPSVMYDRARCILLGRSAFAESMDKLDKSVDVVTAAGRVGEINGVPVFTDAFRPESWRCPFPAGVTVLQGDALEIALPFVRISLGQYAVSSSSSSFVRLHNDLVARYSKL